MDNVPFFRQRRFWAAVIAILAGLLGYAKLASETLVVDDPPVPAESQPN